MFKSKFGKFMMIYVVLLTAVIVFLWCKLWDIVDVYEKELPEYAVEKYLKDFTEAHYKAMVLENSDIKVSDFEDRGSIIDEYGKISLDVETLTYKKKAGKFTNTTPVYSLMSEGKEVAVVYFKESKEGKGLAKWELENEEVQGIELSGTESITISAPEDSKVFINDMELSDDYVTGTTEEAELLKNVEKYIENIPQMKIYTVDGLYKEPTVKVISADGSEMEAREGENIYSYGFQASEEFAGANESWIIEMINAYALYISNDGPFSDLTPYLYEDNTLEGLKSKLSTIGVTWYTDHNDTSLAKQQVGEFKQYGENCFSCIATFEQTIYGVGFKEGNNVVNENKLICIFVKDESGQWKWAGMNTLEID